MEENKNYKSVNSQRWKVMDKDGNLIASKSNNLTKVNFRRFSYKILIR